MIWQNRPAILSYQRKNIKTNRFCVNTYIYKKNVREMKLNKIKTVKIENQNLKLNLYMW